VATAALVVWLVIGVVQGASGDDKIGNAAHLTGLVTGVVCATTNRERSIAIR
jgi:membrane associated rhomboid family serine protease